MKKQQGQGLLTVLGIAAGAFAWYKYKNMSPERKQELHDKVNSVGQQFKDTFNSFETTVSEKYGQLLNGMTGTIENITNSSTRDNSSKEFEDVMSHSIKNGSNREYVDVTNPNN